MNLVLLKEDAGVCTLTINRPDYYNALNHKILSELDSKFDWISQKSDCRAVILTGMGNKAFIAGADIKAMSQMDAHDAGEFSKLGQDLTVKIENLTIPVIAAVNGFALGGGCEFAMACHIRYASENAVFGQPEVRLGLIAGFGGTQRLPRLIGRGRALEMLLSGDNISAKEAFQMGLVNKVVPAFDLISETKLLAKKIVENGPIAVSATIKAVINGADLPMKDRLRIEAKEFAGIFNTEDKTEGLSAFIDKRSPDFKGK